MHGRIALVTTDRAIAVIVPLILGRAGYSVDALGPVEALGFLSEGEPDALILDLGLEQAACFVRLAGRCKWRGPTIVLSSQTRPDLETAAVDADVLVRKPFDPEEILAAITQLAPLPVL